MFRVLVVNDISSSFSDEVRALLGDNVDVTYKRDIKDIILPEHVKGKNYDAIVLRSAKISDRTIPYLKPNILIIRGGTKTSNLENLKLENFEIQNTPGENSASAAEKLIADIWHLGKKQFCTVNTPNSVSILDKLVAIRCIKQANLDRQATKSIYFGQEIFAKDETDILATEKPFRNIEFGIIGITGVIGNVLSKLLQSAGGTIFGWSPSSSKQIRNPTQSPFELINNINICSTVDVLSQSSDIILVCVADHVRGLITAEHINNLSRNSCNPILANITNHDVLTEEAKNNLVNHLKNSEISYSIDHVVNNLADLPNISMTNHIGAETSQAQAKIAAAAARQIYRKAMGLPSLNIVNLNPYLIHTSEFKTCNSYQHFVNKYVTIFTPNNAYLNYKDIAKIKEHLPGISTSQLVTLKPSRIAYHEVIAHTLCLLDYKENLHGVVTYIYNAYVTTNDKMNQFNDDYTHLGQQVDLVVTSFFANKLELTKSPLQNKITNALKILLNEESFQQLESNSKKTIENLITVITSQLYNADIKTRIQEFVAKVFEKLKLNSNIHFLQQNSHSSRSVIYYYGGSGAGKSTALDLYIDDCLASHSNHTSHNGANIFFDPIRPLLLDDLSLIKDIGIDFEVLTHEEVKIVINRQLLILSKMLTTGSGPATICVDRVNLDHKALKSLSHGNAKTKVTLITVSPDTALQRICARGLNSNSKPGEYYKFNDTRTILKWHKNISKNFFSDLNFLKSISAELTLLNNNQIGIKYAETILRSEFSSNTLHIYSLSKLIDFLTISDINVDARDSDSLYIDDKSLYYKRSYNKLAQLATRYSIRVYNASHESIAKISDDLILDSSVF